ncbi:hypothetical protein [Streptomyces sp. NPDC050704]|uniref:hypothetical protein n=1 Tax=Streptomyces sp. NPDC050704 TaxID=3157219 RepID=UPI00342A6AA7
MTVSLVGGAGFFAAALRCGLVSMVLAIGGILGAVPGVRDGIGTVRASAGRPRRVR